MTIIMYFLKYELSKNVTREEQKAIWDLILSHLSNVSQWFQSIL